VKERDEKPLFVRGPSLGARMLLLATASLALMVLDYRNNHLQSIRNALSVVVYPIRVAVDLPFSATRWLKIVMEPLTYRSRIRTGIRI